MKLYYAQTLHSRKVCALAKYLGLPVEYQFLDLRKGAHKSPEFLAINPNGRAPALVDADVVLWESNAIMAHMAERAQSPLWPNDAKQATVLQWLSWDSEHFKPLAGTFYFEYIIKPVLNMGPPDQKTLAATQTAFTEMAKVLDRHLQENDFLAGSALTIADFAVAVTLPYVDTCELPLADFPYIIRWHDRLLTHDAWRNPWPA